MIRSLLRIEDLTDSDISDMLVRANEIKRGVLPKFTFGDPSRKTIGLYFEQPSTRTKTSFAVAITNRGHHSVWLDQIHSVDSSTIKGESEDDIFHVYQLMLDALIIRTPANLLAIHYLRDYPIPIINAGDEREHPTQAFADLLTLQDRFGFDHIKDLNIALVGAIYQNNQNQYVRTVKSFRDLLLRMGAKVDFELVRGEINNIPKNIDVIYLVRPLGSYRYYTGEEEYPRIDKHYNHNAVILHPLPRNYEIAVDFDSDDRALYWASVSNLVPIREAVLDWIFAHLKD